MARAARATALSVVGFAVLSVWACSGDRDDLAADNAAGHAGTTDVAGQPQGGAGAGAGAGAGDGGRVTNGGAGDGGGAGEVCESRTVSDYCAQLQSRIVPQACPENPGDFELEKNRCGPYNGVDRYASACGGVVIEVWGDKMDGANYYAEDYSFDAHGALVGVAFSTDIAYGCPSAWGSPCAPTGEPEPLCAAGGAGGAGGVGGQGAP